MAKLEGKTIQNRYRVDELIGRGGVSEVYKVWDSLRATYLAMKLLHDDIGEDKIFLRRFKREAANLSKLQHPNIVRFYGLEQEDYLTFMLMDYVDGNSLRREIFRSGGPLPLERVQQVMRSVCSGLHYAHTTGFVHCDIKPANILIDEGDRVLVSDFGIARMSETATATFVGAGTPAYMAPEQIRGQIPAAQTDIYSLGIVLYEMLTGGERPFTGDYASTGSISERLRWEQLNLQPPSPRKWNPEISLGLEAVVLKCLEKDPAKRYPNALDFLNALELALGDRIETSTSLVRQEAETPPPKHQIFQPVRGEPLAPPEPKVEVREPGQKRRLAAWVIVVSVVCVGVIMVALFGGFGDRSSLAHSTRQAKTVVSLSTNTLIPTQTLTDRPKMTLTPTSEVFSSVITSKDGVMMAYVPAGEFLMGSNGGYPAEQPIHTVYVDAFWIQIYEVTNLEFLQFLNIYGNQTGSDDDTWLRENGKNLHIFNEEGEWFVNEGYENHPVVQVNWDGANAYCENLGGRLPTEAEWEKAARGGLESTNYPWGDQISVCTPGAENGAQSDKCSGGLQPVGSFAPNGYGLYDMAGNLWEWVSDWYGENYYSVSPYENPLGPDSGERRVCRGGAWDARYLRVATRNFCGPSAHADYLGFRCVVDVEP